MATEQPQTKLPLAVTIPSAPTLSQPETAARSLASAAAAPVPAPKTTAQAPSTSAVSTPKSGMHSPPLSNTVEEEDIEMNSAAAATKNTGAARTVDVSAVKPTTPPPTSCPPPKAPTLAQLATSSHTAGIDEWHATPNGVSGTATNSTNPTIAPSLFSGLTNTDINIQSSRSDSSMVDENKQRDLEMQRYNKEKTIEHVLKQGKILKVSRRLRTRLEYAILKIRRGWSKYTLKEVESLIQPACSPRFTPGQIQQSLSRQTSPRLPERKRAVKHSANESTTSNPTSGDADHGQDVEMACRPPAPPVHFRPRMPSLSQFKDSELYLPAKSLMEIATSKPEPGYLSSHQTAQSGRYSRHGTPEPLYRDPTPVRSGYSTPVAPSSPVLQSSDTFNDEQDKNAPSAAQAARTILMLSSPTRPPPRTLNQNYIVEMHAGNPTHTPLGEWTSPYPPSTASSAPSDKTPAMSTQSAPFTGEDRGGNQKNSLFYTPKPAKQHYSGLYGTGHEPSSPSPLSTSLIPLNEPLDRVTKSFSRSSSPTLKRAVRFAAEATNASELELAGRTECNNGIYPGSQPGHDDKKGLSYSSEPTGGEGYLLGYDNNRAMTPPPAHSSSGAMASHGMRTPPPSAGQDLNLSHYTMASKRRRSESPPLGMTDLSTKFRHGAPIASSHPTQPGPFVHH